MKTLLFLATFACSIAAFADGYHGVRIDTTTATAEQRLAGKLGVSASSTTWSTYTIVLDGTNPAIGIDTTPASGFSFLVAPSSLALTTSAYLGVGTSAPTRNLHINGTMRLTSGFYDSNNAVGTANQFLRTTGSATEWVDITTAAIVGGDTVYVNVIGDTMTGHLTISGSSLTVGGDIGVSGLVDGRDIDGQFTQVATDTTTIAADVATLDTSTQSLQTQITSNDSDISTLDTSTQSLQTQVTSNDTELATLATTYVDVAGDTMTGQLTTQSTLTVQGNAFSVGTSTFVVSDGNVGIGNTAPFGLLEIGDGTMTVLSNGNVGIGTTNPAEALHVVGKSTFTDTVTIDGADGGNTGLVIRDLGTAKYGIDMRNSGLGTGDYWISLNSSDYSYIQDGKFLSATSMETRHFVINSYGIIKGGFYWHTQANDHLSLRLQTNNIVSSGWFHILNTGIYGIYDVGYSKVVSPHIKLAAYGSTYLADVPQVNFSVETNASDDGGRAGCFHIDASTGVVISAPEGFYVNESSGSAVAPYFTVQGDGNVGIGDSTPDQLLTVNGNVEIETLGNALQFSNALVRIYRGGLGNDQMIFDTVDNGFSFRDNDVSKAELNHAGDLQLDGDFKADGAGDSYFTGNVGINDTGPDALLDVKSNAAATGFILSISSQSDTTGDILSVKGDGNVGIGHSAPGSKLEIASGGILTVSSITAPSGDSEIYVSTSVHISAGHLEFPDGTTMTSANIGSADSISSSSSAIINADNDGNGDGDIGFRINGSTKMVVTNAGNVGISTATPGALFSIGDGTMVVKSNGNVGIGTTNPVSKLYVEGTSNEYLVRFVNLHQTAGVGLRVVAGDSASERIALFEDKDGNDRFVFGADGSGGSDGTWAEFTPDIVAETGKDNPTPTDYLEWALSDAKKPHKPYDGLFPQVDGSTTTATKIQYLKDTYAVQSAEDELEKYGKSATRMAIGTAKWAEWAAQKIAELEQRIQALEAK